MRTEEHKQQNQTKTVFEWLIKFLCCLIIIGFSILFFQELSAAELPYVPLDNCDVTTGWGGPHDIYLDTENQMEGTGCISSSGDDLVSLYKSYTPRNTYLTEENGYLKLWLYISDASRYDNAGQIEITSSGGFDVDEYSWNLNNIYLKDGWNFLSLSMANAGKNGTPDLSAINYFRIYGFYNDSVTIKIDHLIFDDFGEMLLPGRDLDQCNHESGWSGSDPIYQDLDNHMDSYASVASFGSGTNRFVKTYTPVNANVSPENGYLNFWLYVSDISAFDDAGQVEITSSGTADADEYSWNVNCMDLKNGWNQVFLKITDASVIGSPDLQAINFFRFYNFMNKDVLVRIDDIIFTESGPPVPNIVNPNTLHNKVLFGYQGWFGAPGDGSQLDEWVHWFRSSTPSDTYATFDNWPDLTEYDDDELFETNMEYAGGQPAKLYSAYTYKTVDRHFKWMQEHQLDGVFLQRFISGTQWDAGLDFIDKVADNVMKSCEKYERVFAFEFCIQQDEDYWVEVIKNDWMHLVDDLNVTLNPYYLKHKGRPLVGIYGIGFDMYSYATPEEAQELIDWFHSEAPEKYRATIMVGVPESWRTDEDYIDFYSTVDVIKPWSVGRYSDEGSADNFLNQYILPDKDYCDDHQIDYLPVIWPGFSWYNLMRAGEYQKNAFPRNGGNFFWRQSYNVNKADVNMIFIAMFDEVDEGTAMYKIEPHQENTPTTGFWVTLDADGYDLPSDWYLRLASETGRTLREEVLNDYDLPSVPNVLSIDSLHVVPGLLPGVSIPAELHACEEETIQVNSIVSNASWQNWSVGGSGSAAKIYCDNSKSIWLFAGNPCGTSSDTLNLVVHPNPEINLELTEDTIQAHESIVISIEDDYVRYLWNDQAGGPSFTADNTTMNPGENAIELMVTDHNNCTATDVESIYLIDANTINSQIIKDKSIIVFPNPSANYIQLFFNEQVPSEKLIKIYNARGEIVLKTRVGTEQYVNLKINQLSKGNYFIHVNSENYHNIIPIIKN